MKKISLTRGKFALVDDSDFEWLNKWKWQLGSHNYAIRTQVLPKRKTIRMHQLIIKAQKGLQPDHINGNPLDNRRSNLRLATSSENSCNRKTRIDNTSGFKGITWIKKHKRWMAYIWKDKKFFYLGYFKNKIEAIKIRKQATQKYHGEFARV